MTDFYIGSAVSERNQGSHCSIIVASQNTGAFYAVCIPLVFVSYSWSRGDIVGVGTAYVRLYTLARRAGTSVAFVAIGLTSGH